MLSLATEGAASVLRCLSLHMVWCAPHQSACPTWFHICPLAGSTGSLALQAPSILSQCGPLDHSSHTHPFSRNRGAKTNSHQTKDCQDSLDLISAPKTPVQMVFKPSMWSL